MSFNYKELDTEGLDILDVISNADNFNNWMFKTVEPFCTGKILEIGSGVGNISQFFVRAKRDIHVSDIRANYRSILEHKLALKKDHVLDINIVHPEFDKIYAHLFANFDSIFCLNVIEHVEQDSLAVGNICKLLKPKGNLLVLVPAHQTLYNSIDTSLEHYKRYNKKSLNVIMANSGEIVRSFYFNAIGIPAWFISGSLLKNKSIENGKMNFFNHLVPIFKLLDNLFLKKIGLSVITVIIKK